MSASDDLHFTRLAAVIRRTFALAAHHVVERTTTSADIDGWDSLSYAILIMEIEACFDVQLPFERLFTLNDVGELADLVYGAREAGVGDR